jgi:HSP20 family protein
MANRWDGFDQLTGLRETMGDWFERGRNVGNRTDRGADAAPGAQAIPVNIFEAEDFVMVIAPMPGVQAEDLDITVRGTTITLTARERADLKPESGKRYLRHEWRYGPYQRTVELPYAVDDDTAEATFDNGVLTVRVQKAAAARMRRIQVKTTRPGSAGQSGQGQAGEPTRPS